MGARTYATLSIYAASQADIDGIAEQVARPSRGISERNGVFGAHYSTQGRCNSAQVDEHVSLLQSELAASLATLEKAGKGLSEVRLWIFFESAGPNDDFALRAEQVAWLGRMRAEVCVDVWRAEPPPAGPA
jgi:hypothetical protein